MYVGQGQPDIFGNLDQLDIRERNARQEGKYFKERKSSEYGAAGFPFSSSHIVLPYTGVKPDDRLPIRKH